jgi:hypothetical protein
MTTFEQAWEKYSEHWDTDATQEQYDAMRVGWELAHSYQKAQEFEAEVSEPAEEILYHYVGTALDEYGETIGYVEGLLGRPHPIKLEEYHNIRKDILKHTDIPGTKDVRLNSLNKLS